MCMCVCSKLSSQDLAYRSDVHALTNFPNFAQTIGSHLLGVRLQPLLCGLREKALGKKENTT